MKQISDVVKNWKPRLRKCKWFSKVGTGPLDGYERVASWEKAVALLKSESLERACADTDGAIRIAVTDRAIKDKAPNLYREFCDNWDAALDDSRPAARALMDEFIRSEIERLEVPEVVCQEVYSSLYATFLVEMLFDEPPQYLHREMMELFLAGYFPCGYKGKYPKGKIIVY